MPNSRPIRLPPDGFHELELPVRPLRRAVFHRIHRQASETIHYSLSPHHRFSPANLPFPVLYAGKDFETCALEVFGDVALDHNMDIAFSRWTAMALYRLEITARVCDLTDSKIRTACHADLAALLATDLSIPRKWALAIATHPAAFDGILYPSRFTGKTCIALFNRRPALHITSRWKYNLARGHKNSADFLDKYRIRLV